MSSHFMALTSLKLSAAIIRAPIVVSPKMPVLAAIAQMSRAHSDPLVAEAERDNQPGAADGLKDLLYQVKVDCVLVVEAGRVVGILTIQDVLRLTSQQRPLTSLLMEQVMTPPVATLREADFTELSVAMELFREKRIRHLPILDGQDRLVGLATPESLRRAAMMIERQKTEAQLRASNYTQAETALQNLIEGAMTGQDFFPALVSQIAATLKELRANEAQLRAMMEAIPDLLLRVTRDGTCLDFIRSPNQLGEFLPIQRHLSEALPPDLLKRQLDSIEQAIASGIVQVYEQQFPKHNRMAYEEVRISAISSEQALIMVRDITERKQAEKALQASETKSRAILAAIPDLMFRVGADGVYRELVTLNPEIDLFFRGHDPVGLPMEAILPAEIAAVHLHHLEQALRTGQLQIYEQHVQIDGQRRYDEVRAVKSSDDEVLFMIRDITVRKHIETQLQESRAYYQAIIANQTELICRFRPDGSLTFVNDAYCAFFQISTEPWGNASIPRLCDDEREFAQQSLSNLAANDPICTCEYQVIAPSGAIHWQQWTIRPLFDSEGSFIEYLAVGRDITALKEAEAVIQRHLDTIEASIDGISILRDDQYIYLNQSKLDLFGYAQAEDLLGQPWQVLYPPQEIHRLQKDVFPHVRQHGFWRGEAAGKRQDNTVFPMELSLTLTPTGDIIRVCRDITDRKYAEQQLQLLNQQLEARVEERTTALKEREARYHALMNGASDAILLADQRGNLLEANDKAEELLGYTRAELTTMHYSQLYRPEEFSRILAATEELAIQKFVQVSDIDFLSKDGQSIPVDISASVVEINGETIIQGIFRDITERKQAERERQRLFQELQEENTFRQQLVENMAEGVCVCQEIDAFPFYRFSVWNHQMQVITGYTVEEMNHLGWYQSLYPDPEARAQAIARMQRMHRGDNLVAEEWEIQRKDGQRRTFAISTSVLSNHNGQTCVLGLMQDITERKQAQQQLSERNQQLADSNAELARVTRLKDEFLASMSHELRTPLNAILGMTEGLLEGVFGKVNKEQHEALQTIERSSSHLLELINDILDLSKIESGQIELRCEPTAVAALCQYSLAFIKQQALKKRIQIEMQLPANPPDLLVDERHIRQALINLLNNAVKFTSEGGRITLTVSGPNPSDAIARPEGLSSKRLSITVADTGIGISPDHIETIFQPFVQIDSALNRQYTGTGLGLALVERIVRLHGGDMNIISEIGVGSRFTIDLPCTTSPPSSQEAEIPSYSLIEPNQNQLKPAPIILLAEDNEASVSTISSYLRAKGYLLLVAKNGLEAIALTRSGNPDLILMDIQMPRMDGLEAIQKIRQDLNCADIPIIALTALAMTGDRERCLATGATDYLSKPVKLKRLTATIQQLLTS